MTVYQFDGVTSGASTGTFVAGGDNPDFVNITYGEGFFTTNIRNEGTNVVIESSLGGTFILQGVVIDQLTSANFGMNGDGTVAMGTSGFDWLFGNIVVGKGGPDWIDGTPDNDFLAGNGGNDWIDGNGGMDRIRGGQGDDLIEDFGAGSIVYGDKGADEIIAGNFMNDEDDDTGVTIFGGSGDPNDPLDGDDYIEGSAYDDFLQGNGGDDQVYGGDGDDEIRGGKGDDDLGGGWGDDWVRGDKGDDWISGWAGDDKLEGGDGDDDIEGGRGADVMSGGSGENTFWFEWEGGQQSVIQNLSVESMSEDVLNLPGFAFGNGQLNNLDRITDLKLGDDDDSIDTLGFDGWNGTYVNVDTVDNVSASTVQDLIDIFLANDHGTSYYEDAIIIEVNGGALAGKSFLAVDTDAGGSYEPEYLLQVTGYTGDLDASDIHGYYP